MSRGKQQKLNYVGLKVKVHELETFNLKECDLFRRTNIQKA